MVKVKADERSRHELVVGPPQYIATVESGAYTQYAFTFPLSEPSIDIFQQSERMLSRTVCPRMAGVPVVEYWRRYARRERARVAPAAQYVARNPSVHVACGVYAPEGAYALGTYRRVKHSFKNCNFPPKVVILTCNVGDP